MLLIMYMFLRLRIPSNNIPNVWKDSRLTPYWFACQYQLIKEFFFRSAAGYRPRRGNFLAYFERVSVFGSNKNFFSQGGNTSFLRRCLRTFHIVLSYTNTYRRVFYCFPLPLLLENTTSTSRFFSVNQGRPKVNPPTSICIRKSFDRVFFSNSSTSNF